MVTVIQRLYCEWIEVPTALGVGDTGTFKTSSRGTDWHNTLSPSTISQSSMLCLLYVVTSIIADQKCMRYLE